MRKELDLLEFGWEIICNAGGGDWKKETKDFQKAAARFRKDYFALLKSANKEGNKKKCNCANGCKNWDCDKL